MTETSRVDPAAVHEAWERACRVDALLSHFDTPPSSLGLVEAIIERARTGGSQPPDQILIAYAGGLTAPQWTASGEVVQRQIGLLMLAAADAIPIEAKVLAHVHMVLSTTAAQLTLGAWQDQAKTDELTRLPNDFALKEELNRLVSDGRSVRIGFIDLNGLKAVNDSEGHEAGDRLIKGFADRLHQFVRDAGGNVFRPHGDEFVVTMHTAVGQVDEVLDALRKSNEYSFSWGVSEWPTDDEDIETVKRKADDTMYVMKKAHKARQKEEQASLAPDGVETEAPASFEDPEAPSIPD